MPAVTVRLRAKLALLVARRFLSLTALLVMVRASSSSVCKGQEANCEMT